MPAQGGFVGWLYGDPPTALLQADDFWVNLTTKKWRYFDGAAPQDFPGGAGGAPHNILDAATHLDSLTRAVARGMLITGQGATAKWDGLALGVSGKLARSNGTDLLYSTFTMPDTFGAGSLVYASALDTLAALGIGSADDILKVVGGLPVYGKLVDANVAAGAGILESKLALNFATHAENHKGRHVSGGADAFAKGDVALLAARYLEPVTPDPGSDSRRIWIVATSKRLKFWSDEATPTLQELERLENKGATSGYASLDSTTKVPTAELGTGTADSTTFLRGDRTWATPSGGGAPTDAEYVVAAAHASLSAERVTTDTATVTWDHLTAGQAKANVPDDAITNAKLADMAANTVKANVGVLGDPEDLAIPTNTVLGRKGADIVAETIATAQIADSQVTYAKLQNVSATDRLLGRDSAGAGVIEELTPAAVLTMLGAYSSVVLQSFTATGTYTPTSGMKHCLVIITGGGGGGGGADTDGTSGSVGAGGGGGAGGTAIGRFTAAQIGASQTVTIGSAGAGGSASGGNGTAGGDSTFGALLTGNGGALGTGSGTSTVDNTDSDGGAGGTASGGTLNIDGGDGEDAIGGGVDGTTDLSFAKGGRGGSSFWGGGGKGGGVANSTLTTDETQAGNAGKAYGSGGGGGADLNAGTGVTGGAGKAGVCLVIEYL